MMVQLEVAEAANHGGVANVGLQLYESGAYAHVGVVVSSSPACPMGACGLSNGTVTALHANHRNSEEDVASNWLLTEEHETETQANMVYQDTVFERWGMRHVDGTTHETIQGVDYTTAPPNAYGDAFIVASCRLSQVTGAGLERQFFHGRSFPCSLVFAFAPNVDFSTTRRRSSFQRRTYNPAMATYENYAAGVTWAYFAALGAMAASGCDLAVLSTIGAGPNAGPHRIRIRADLPAIVGNLLNGSHGVPFGLYFTRVILVF